MKQVAQIHLRIKLRSIRRNYRDVIETHLKLSEIMIAYEGAHFAGTPLAKNYVKTV
jgi:hypothetical protein